MGYHVNEWARAAEVSLRRSLERRAQEKPRDRVLEAVRLIVVPAALIALGIFSGVWFGWV